MKAISKLLVAGMLALGTAVPSSYASQAFVTNANANEIMDVTITDELAYRILEGAAGELEAQLNMSISTNFLYSEYKAGKATITYLGHDGVGYVFRVEYMDGVTSELLEDL